MAVKIHGIFHGNEGKITQVLGKTSLKNRKFSKVRQCKKLA